MLWNSRDEARAHLQATLRPVAVAARGLAAGMRRREPEEHEVEAMLEETIDA
jgi:hypothetical protein